MDLVLADRGVQVADAGEDAVYRFQILVERLLGVLIHLFQLGGIGIQLLDQSFRSGAHLNVILRLAGLVTDLLERVVQLAQMRFNNAEGVVAVAHLVQDRLNALQAAQLGVHGAHAGHFRAVTDVQIGVPQLGDAGGQHAVSDPDAVAGMIPVRAAGAEALLLQPLAGIAGGVDIGNVISGHIQTHLRGVDRQTGLCKRTKSTDRTHKILLCTKKGDRQTRKSVFMDWGGSAWGGA